MALKTVVIQGRTSAIICEGGGLQGMVNQAIVNAGWDEWMVRSQHLAIGSTLGRYIHWTSVLTVDDDSEDKEEELFFSPKPWQDLFKKEEE